MKIIKLQLFTLLVLSSYPCLVFAAEQKTSNLPPTYQQWLQEGADNLAAKNFEDARQNYAEAAKTAKTNVEKILVQLSIANIDLAQSKFKDSQFKLLQILTDKTIPDFISVMVKMSLGQAYAGNGQNEEARSTFREMNALEKSFDRLKILNQISIAQTFISEKDYQSAQTELEKIKSYSQTVPTAQLTSDFWLGKITILQKRWDEARVKFSDVLKVESNNFTQQERMTARIYQDQARLENALSYEKEGNRTQARSELQVLIERPSVAPQVLAEAKKQLKLLQPTDQIPNETK